MEERREFTRLPAETEVHIRLCPKQKKTTQPGMGKNISGGGILLSSDQRIEPGALIDLEVITPMHRSFTHVFKPLQARARVIRVEGESPPFDIAAAFIEVERD